jgi:hypothetical protein
MPQVHTRLKRTHFFKEPSRPRDRGESKTWSTKGTNQVDQHQNRKLVPGIAPMRPPLLPHCSAATLHTTHYAPHTTHYARYSPQGHKTRDLKVLPCTTKGPKILRLLPTLAWVFPPEMRHLATRPTLALPLTHNPDPSPGPNPILNTTTQQVFPRYLITGHLSWWGLGLECTFQDASSLGHFLCSEQLGAETEADGDRGQHLAGDRGEDRR